MVASVIDCKDAGNEDIGLLRNWRRGFLHLWCFRTDVTDSGTADAMFRITNNPTTDAGTIVVDTTWTNDVLAWFDWPRICAMSVCIVFVSTIRVTYSIFDDSCAFNSVKALATLVPTVTFASIKALFATRLSLPVSSLIFARM